MNHNPALRRALEGRAAVQEADHTGIIRIHDEEI
jgi:hypothetical protein